MLVIGHDPSWTTEWAPVASAVAAAFAALASWVVVMLTRRSLVRSLRPELQAQPSINADGFRRRIHIENNGPALARLVGFCYVVASVDGDRLVQGHVEPTAVLRPGTGVTIVTNAVVLEESPVRGITSCIDGDETTHAWDVRNSRHRSWRRRRWHRRNKETEEAFRAFYRGTDLTGMPRADFKFQRS